MAVDDDVTVLNLHAVPEVAPHESYIVPLAQFREDYVIPRLDGQADPPRIYPDPRLKTPLTPRLIEQAREILRDIRP